MVSTSEPIFVPDYESPAAEPARRRLFRRNWLMALLVAATAMLFVAMLGVLSYKSFDSAQSTSGGLIVAVGGPEDEGTEIIVTGPPPLFEIPGKIKKDEHNRYTWRLNVPVGRYTLKINHPTRGELEKGYTCAVPDRQRVLIDLTKWNKPSTAVPPSAEP